MKIVIVAIAALLAVGYSKLKAAELTQAEKDKNCGVTWSQQCYLKSSPPVRKLWNADWLSPDRLRPGQNHVWTVFKIHGDEGLNSK